jgi:hypothetical protein
MDNKKVILTESWKNLSKRMLKENTDIVEPEYIQGPDDDKSSFDEEIKKLDELIDYLHANCKNLTKSIFFTPLAGFLENNYSELVKFQKKLTELKGGADKIMDKYHDIDDRLFEIKDSNSGYSDEMKNKAKQWNSLAYKSYQKLSLVEERLLLMDQVVEFLDDIKYKVFDNDRNQKILDLMLNYK